jgi:hypothetical protein
VIEPRAVAADHAQQLAAFRRRLLATDPVLEDAELEAGAAADAADAAVNEQQRALGTTAARTARAAEHSARRDAAASPGEKRKADGAAAKAKRSKASSGMPAEVASEVLDEPSLDFISAVVEREVFGADHDTVTLRHIQQVLWDELSAHTTTGSYTKEWLRAEIDEHVLAWRAAEGAAPAPAEVEEVDANRSADEESEEEFVVHKAGAAAAKMLEVIAKGGDDLLARAVAPGARPASVNQLAKKLEEEGKGAFVFSTISDSLGVLENDKLDDNWARNLLELMRLDQLSGRCSIHHLRKPGSGDKSSKYNWCVLTSDGLKILSSQAKYTNMQKLNFAASIRRTNTMETAMRKTILKQFEEKGIDVCGECTMPLLKPSDPQFEEKKALIKTMCHVKTQLDACGGYRCGCEVAMAAECM